ncbi:MAG: DUF1492 domain-containing protein [Candidatus Limivicinus sp.]
MNAKEFLEQTRFLDMRITAKLAQLEELHRLMLRVGGSDGTAAKIAAMQEEIDRDVDELVDLKKEITAVIRRVSRPEYQTLLELRYLCFWNWEKIGANLHIGQSRLFEIHRCALTEIDKILAESESIAESS